MKYFNLLHLLMEANERLMDGYYPIEVLEKLTDILIDIVDLNTLNVDNILVNHLSEANREDYKKHDGIKFKIRGKYYTLY